MKLKTSLVLSLSCIFTFCLQAQQSPMFYYDQCDIPTKVIETAGKSFYVGSRHYSNPEMNYTQSIQIARIKRDGSVHWAKKLNILNGSVGTYSICATPDKGVVIATVGGDDGVLEGDADYVNVLWVAKLDSSGKEKWLNCINLDKAYGQIKVMTTRKGESIIITSPLSKVGPVRIIKLDSKGLVTFSKQYTYNQSEVEPYFNEAIEMADGSWLIAVSYLSSGPLIGEYWHISSTGEVMNTYSRNSKKQFSYFHQGSDGSLFFAGDGEIDSLHQGLIFLATDATLSPKWALGFYNDSLRRNYDIRSTRLVKDTLFFLGRVSANTSSEHYYIGAINITTGQLIQSRTFKISPKHPYISYPGELLLDEKGKLNLIFYTSLPAGFKSSTLKWPSCVGGFVFGEIDNSINVPGFDPASLKIEVKPMTVGFVKNDGINVTVSDYTFNFYKPSHTIDPVIFNTIPPPFTKK